MKPSTIEEWAAAEVAKGIPQPAPEWVSEEAIAANVKLGMTRAQAITALAAQAAPAKSKRK